jgi:hypothetical protein
MGLKPLGDSESETILRSAENGATALNWGHPIMLLSRKKLKK